MTSSNKTLCANAQLLSRAGHTNTHVVDHFHIGCIIEFPINLADLLPVLPLRSDSIVSIAIGLRKME